MTSSSHLFSLPNIPEPSDFDDNNDDEDSNNGKANENSADKNFKSLTHKQQLKIISNFNTYGALAQTEIEKIKFISIALHTPKDSLKSFLDSLIAENNPKILTSLATSSNKSGEVKVQLLNRMGKVCSHLGEQNTRSTCLLFS